MKSSFVQGPHWILISEDGGQGPSVASLVPSHNRNSALQTRFALWSTWKDPDSWMSFFPKNASSTMAEIVLPFFFLFYTSLGTVSDVVRHQGNRQDNASPELQLFEDFMNAQRSEDQGYPIPTGPWPEKHCKTETCSLILWWLVGLQQGERVTVQNGFIMLKRNHRPKMESLMLGPSYHQTKT
ncbi:uncharacterized protein LOC116570709 isoform X10 [Mustela erminea]|uniref:uncharacterized protein LOC116570709 isoform X10 n=1 Tax=Mustela erminea TaxID=36723 RepID=UPI0013871BA0|nr:uncharacterized protein LOC116570709 isoform X10 [Mustela erminea]XP_032164087.1 uncharacterized protein LOC116570709 isoform X10 [Mustela erminea]